MTSSFDPVRAVLERPEALRTLLEPKGPITLGNARWQPLAQFYPATAPRASYRVRAGTGDYFVKLNIRSASVQREAHMLQLLEQAQMRRFLVPSVVDVRVNVPIVDELSGSWIAMPWAEGSSLRASDQATWSDAAAGLLANLHALPIDYEAIQRWYGILPPAPAELAQKAHALRRQHLREAIAQTQAPLSDRLAEIDAAWRPLSFGSLSLVHGDFHLDNLLRCAAAIRPESLMLLDWEDGTLDTPLSDVAHLAVHHVLLKDQPLPVGFIHHYWRAALLERRPATLPELYSDLALLAASWVARALRHAPLPLPGPARLFQEKAMSTLAILLDEEKWHE